MVTALVVDDHPDNRSLLSRHLTKLGFTVHQAEDGRRAMTLIRSRPVDVVLLDVMMPEMDGFQVLAQIKANEGLRHIPVIMISALDEMEAVTRCIENGAADYLPKPFDPVLLKARVGACVDIKRLYDKDAYYRQQIEEYNLALEDRVREQVREISLAQQATIFALSKLAESRDPETGDHLERMREYCKVLARRMRDAPGRRGLVDGAFVECIYAASPLHDIGKVGVQDDILRKPGKLTPEEFEIMKTHASLGAETLRAVYHAHPANDFIRMGIEIAECHHEKWNGGGYPLGLAGEAIPLSARILALADVYDAMRSKRCYKDPMPHEQVRAVIIEQRGVHFDPDVVDAFLAAEKDFLDIAQRFA
ncbi:MAG: response regulator [Alphaproteobacteria bacterium]|nr:response regulator [Alphaproteobacteria bacterium]